MTGFLSKLFGGSKDASKGNEYTKAVDEVLGKLIDKAGFDLSFEVTSPAANTVSVELKGGDENLVTDRDGQLLDSIQLYLLRVLQHRFHDEKVDVVIDCSQYRQEANKQLEDLAERLKDKALTSNKSVYFRALPPKDRKVIHQYLANDERVKSRSVGEGLYKRIKIYPARPVEVEK